MTLGAFITSFSHNNLIRLVYKDKGGHRLVLNDWDDVSMDWEVNKAKGKNRHYIDNQVLGLTSILTGGHYPEALNIMVEELENQPFVYEKKDKKVKRMEYLEISKVEPTKGCCRCEVLTNLGRTVKVDYVDEYGIFLEDNDEELGWKYNGENDELVVIWREIE